jgi:hypothetical protein
VLDAAKKRCRIAFCTKAAGSEGSVCDRNAYQTVRADHDLPVDVEFLGGTVTITAIGEGDAPTVKFHVKKAVPAAMVMQQVRLLYPADLEYSLRYSTDAPGSKGK